MKENQPAPKQRRTPLSVRGVKKALTADIKRIAAEIAELRSTEANTRANLLRFMSVTWAANLLDLPKDVMLDRMIRASVNSADLYAKNGEYNKADVVIDHLLADLKQISGIKLPKQKADNLIEKLNNLPQDKLTNVDELIKVVLGLKAEKGGGK